MAVPPPRLVAMLVVASASAACAGCAALGLPQAAGFLRARHDTNAATPRPATLETLALERVLVRHDRSDGGLDDRLWTFVDEQALDDGLRRRLAANGLRAGVVTGHLPSDLESLFQPTGAGADQSATGLGTTAQILQLPAGRPGEIVAAAGIPELVLLEAQAAGIQGGTFRDCSALVTVRAWPAADGRVRLEVVPELKHGPLQRTWIGEEGMFRLETGQARQRFDRLRIVTTLPRDAMLVIGCTDDSAATLGDALFRDRSAGDVAGRQLLAIRPRLGGDDPLFTAEPLPAAAEEPAP